MVALLQRRSGYASMSKQHHRFSKAAWHDLDRLSRSSRQQPIGNSSCELGCGKEKYDESCELTIHTG